MDISDVISTTWEISTLLSPKSQKFSAPLPSKENGGTLRTHSWDCSMSGDESLTVPLSFKEEKSWRALQTFSTKTETKDYT